MIECSEDLEYLLRYSSNYEFTEEEVQQILISIEERNDFKEEVQGIFNETKPYFLNKHFTKHGGKMIELDGIQFISYNQAAYHFKCTRTELLRTKPMKAKSFNELSEEDKQRYPTIKALQERNKEFFDNIKKKTKKEKKCEDIDLEEDYK